MDSSPFDDPLFTRYKAAWSAYQFVCTDGDIAPMPYQRALADPSNHVRQAAAIELAEARDAWLSDPAQNAPLGTIIGQAAW